MGKKVVIKKVMMDRMLPDGSIVQEEDKSLIPNLYGLAGAKVTTPEDALRAAQVKTKIANLNLRDKDEDDLIFEDEEFNYLNDIIDPKSGKYLDNLGIGAWIAPLVIMFRAVTDIKLKEETKENSDDK